MKRLQLLPVVIIIIFAACNAGAAIINYSITGNLVNLEDDPTGSLFADISGYLAIDDEGISASGFSYPFGNTRWDIVDFSITVGDKYNFSGNGYLNHASHDRYLSLGGVDGDWQKWAFGDDALYLGDELLSHYEWDHMYSREGQIAIGAPSLSINRIEQVEPVPEVSTLILMVFGISGLLGIKKKR